MADRIRSTEDAALQALFQGEPFADDGFSARVVRRIERRLWLRRWLVPSATLLGGLIAAGPVSELLTNLSGELLASAAVIAPALTPLPAIVAAALPAALLLVALLGALRMLDE